MDGRELGHVTALWRYPVKSMAPQALDQVEVSWHGLVGDRRWAFIRDGTGRSGFPWLTIRELPEMRHYRPSFVEPDRVETSATMVRTPSGEDLDVVDPRLAQELGHGASVLKQGVGSFDQMPLSLITTQTVAALGALLNATLDVQRFRPNLLIDAPGASFPEDDWVGCVLRIGSLRLRVDQRDKRCVMVNVDPKTSERDPAVLRAIAAEHDSSLGVYGSTVQPGCVAVGDIVRLDG